MKIESIKTVILVILVLISLTLTVGLWNFSPQLNQIDNSTVSRETSIKGGKLTVKDVIVPSHVVFHKTNGDFGLIIKESERTLYQDMQKWSIQQFGPLRNRTQPIDIQTPSVELIFPEEIPFKMLRQLFKISENEILPEGSFKRIYFEPDMDSQSTIEVTFVSANLQQTLSADIYVQETNPHNKLLSYLNNEDALMELTSFTGKAGNPIYLPKEQLSLPKRTYTINEILDFPLVNYLFQDPTAVKSIGGYYTDGDRKLENHYIYSNKKYMEFDNPISPDYQSWEREEIISKSIAFVNNHDGWTDQFDLIEIDEANQTIRYQLTVKGYPIFERLGEMEQVWQKEELTAYDRPLIDLATPFNNLGDYEDPTTLSSGEELISYMNSKQFQFNVQLIEDIRIGYSVMKEENEDIIKLQPTWFMKVNNSWRPINLNESSEPGGI